MHTDEVYEGTLIRRLDEFAALVSLFRIVIHPAVLLVDPYMVQCVCLSDFSTSVEFVLYHIISTLDNDSFRLFTQTHNCCSLS